MFGQYIGVGLGPIGFYKGRGGVYFDLLSKSHRSVPYTSPLTMPLPVGQDPANLAGKGLYLMPTTAYRTHKETQPEAHV